MQAIQTLSRIVGIGGAMLALSTTSQAVPITVAGSGGNVLVDQAAAANGSFDINAAAAALGFSSQYSIASASLSFLFRDNSDARSVVTTLETSQIYRGQDVCTGSLQSSCSQRWYYIDEYLTLTVDPSETARVTVGTLSGSATSAMSQSSFRSGLRLSGEYACSPFGCGTVPNTRRRCGPLFGVTFCDGPWPIYEEYFSLTQLSSGDFSLTLGLDAGTLFDLGTDGLLDFTVGSAFGNFNFLSASLTADITEGSPLVPPVVTPVSEPSTLLLMGLGLLLVTKRKRGLI